MRMRAVFFLTFLLLTFSMVAEHRELSDVSAVAKKVKPSSLSENDQRVFDYYFQEALNLKLKGDFSAAFDLFQHCVQIDSLNAQVWFEWAFFYTNLKQNEWALNAMKKAWQLDEKNEWYVFGLANMYLSVNKIAEAVSMYETLAKSRSNDENILYRLAGLYAQTQKFKAAIGVYDQVERLIGKNESVSFEKYKLYKELNKPRKAIREISSLRTENPYDVEYILLLGDAWLDLGRPRKALAEYEIARKMDAGNPAVALSFADFYNQTGDSVAAQKQLLLALTNPDTDVDTKLSIFGPILISYMQSADSMKIPEYFNLLLRQHPNEYKIRDMYVQWLLRKGQKLEAKNELRTVLDLNPNQLQAWKNYLELNVEGDNQEGIRAICNEALVYFPKESVFWFYLGLSWMSQDNVSEKEASYRKAIDAFQQALVWVSPDDKALLSRVEGLVGDAYLALGEKDKAYAFFDKALDVFAGNILVLNNYAYYLSEEGGDLAKAERMSRKTIEAEPKNPTYLDTFAWIFFKQGKYSLAKIYIERAVANDSDSNAVIFEHYGDILWFNDEKEAARVQWRKALTLEGASETLSEKVRTGNYVAPQ